MDNNSAQYEITKKWEEVQNRINKLLEEILLKIEWHYGEGRAPIEFPPKFDLIRHGKKPVEYICSIKPDYENAQSIRYSADNPEKLFKIVKEDMLGKYSINE